MYKEHDRPQDWGIGTDPDSPPLRTTVCDRLERKARIQDSAFPLIPY